MLSFLTPSLPKEVLKIIFKMSYDPKPAFLSENQILAILGRSANDVFVDSDLIDERILWLRHHNLPFLGCDDIYTATNLLQFPEKKFLRVEDAERIMVAIDLRHPFHHSRIAMEKAVVIKTLHRGVLPKSIFSVGLCYHGAPACTNKMSFECVQNIILRKAGGGSGGGGGM
jgi:hypothetical protein